jgi:hypothetical protein
MSTATAVATETETGCGPGCEPDCTGACSGCGRHRPDLVGLTVMETEPVGAGDFGFCSLGCFVVFVRARWIDADRDLGERLRDTTWGSVDV